MFPAGPRHRSYLKDECCYEFNSEFSVEDSHGKFVVEEE
jgi:hypothetical protein